MFSRTPNTKRTALHIACITGYPDVVSFLASMAMDMRPRGRAASSTQKPKALAMEDAQKSMPIHYAAREGGPTSLKVLLSLTRSPASWLRALNSRGLSPLHLAAEGKHRASLDMLLEAEITNYFLSGGDKSMTPLHLAVESGSVDCVRFLMTHERTYTPLLLRKNNVGENALHTAVNLAVNLLGSDVRSGRNYAEIIELLLSGEGSLELVSSLQDDGWSPLHIAHTNATVTELLLNSGASIYAGQTTPCGSTALALAAKAGCAVVVSVLLKRDSEHRNYPSGLRQDDGGYTPLHWAARNGHTEVVAILLRHSNDPMLKVNGVQDTEVPCEGTALHLAYVNGHLAAFKLILENLLEGGGIPGGYLHKSMGYERQKLVKMLLTYSWAEGDIVDINHQTDEGHSVLFYAAAWGYTDICRMLLEKGINRNLQDNEGRVAADVANSQTIRDLILHWGEPNWTSDNLDEQPRNGQDCRDINTLGMKNFYQLNCRILDTSHKSMDISGFFYHCCDCVRYGHGINICRPCFDDKGKRCKDVQLQRGGGEGCIYKIRFYKGGLVSFSELWQWVADLKDPTSIRRCMSDIPGSSGAPDRDPDESPLEDDIANPSEPSTAREISSQSQGIPQEPSYAEELPSTTAGATQSAVRGKRRSQSPPEGRQDPQKRQRKAPTRYR